MQDNWPLGWVRERLAYAPRSPELFAAALTHRSAAGDNNERLEFLGDAVLNFLIADRLYREFPSAPEGDLSRLRARVVSQQPLAGIAAGLGIGEALRLGSGELKTGGFRRESILADALEALTGALWLDAGLETTRALIVPLFDDLIRALPHPEALKDAKTRLQEHLQARGLPLPRYTLDRVTGEPHEQVFHVRCETADAAVAGEGCGSSRRRAEQQAAERLLERLAAGGGPS
ncbi:MAG: Ribonuclease 3 [Steroidobacteraceae bacterium]|nr:Ribonuclease 3 [Steroidobacteraceae bacterium]